MTTLDRAQQLSDATFSNIEVAFYYLFATPIGWTFWGVLAVMILCGLTSQEADFQREKERRAHGERLRAEQAERLKPELERHAHRLKVDRERFRRGLPPLPYERYGVPTDER